MKERLEAIKKAALEKIEQADAMDSLNDIRVSVLGKKGELTQVLKRNEGRSQRRTSDRWTDGQ
mgnify:FL=1